MAPHEEAWCCNPGCVLCGESMDDADLSRCPACGHRLAVEEVRVPLAPPLALSGARALA